ncbi:aminopeptidase [Chloroflexota bacterium]
MLELLKGAKLLVETCAKIQPEDKVLIVVDDEAFPMRMGKVVLDVANSFGAETALAVMKPREGAANEPPHVIAIAMRSVNAVIYITNRHGIAHTDARKEATAAGVRLYQMIAVPEDYFKQEITAADLEKIKTRTEALAQKLTKTRHAWVTTPAGTAITMSLEGRKGIALHPLAEAMGNFPDYAEAAIAPVEGTAEGTMVIDVGILGWEHLFLKSVRCMVKSGRVVEIEGSEDAERLRQIVATDKNASNIAELGIGTSHTIPKVYRATRMDGGIAGTIHIAIGRNNDIGGQTWSQIHHDGLMHCPTVELDGEVVVKDGILV